MRDSIYEWYGFALISCVGVVLALMLQQALGMPEVVQALTELSPWAGTHAPSLSWVAFTIVMLVTGIVLPILMFSDAKPGGTRLGKVGVYSCVVLTIPSVGYLLAVGWHAGKHLLGQ